MTKKIFGIITVCILFVIVGFNQYQAAEIIDNEMEICSNVEYYFDVEGTKHQVIILDENNYYLDSYVYNEGDLVTFPSNVSNLKALIFNQDIDGNLVLAEEVDFSLVDCGYSSETVNYEYNTLGVTVELSDDTLTFTLNNEFSNYQLSVQEVDSKRAKKLSFSDGDVQQYKIINPEVEYIQVKESFTDSDGKSVENYFEIDMSTDVLFLREVNSFSLNTINKSSVISIMDIVLIILLILVFLIFTIKIKKIRKKIKNRKIREMKRKKRRLVKGEDEKDN